LISDTPCYFLTAWGQIVCWPSSNYTIPLHAPQLFGRQKPFPFTHIKRTSWAFNDPKRWIIETPTYQSWLRHRGLSWRRCGFSPGWGNQRQHQIPVFHIKWTPSWNQDPEPLHTHSCSHFITLVKFCIQTCEMYELNFNANALHTTQPDTTFGQPQLFSWNKILVLRVFPNVVVPNTFSLIHFPPKKSNLGLG